MPELKRCICGWRLVCDGAPSRMQGALQREPRQLGRKFVQRDGKGRWELLLSWGRVRKEITSTRHPTTQAHTNTSYLQFRFLFSLLICFPSLFFPLPSFCHPSLKKILCTQNKEILNKRIGSRHCHQIRCKHPLL